LETEYSGVISVKIDRKRKVPVTVLLKALGGYSDNDIKDMFLPFDTGEVKFIEETLKKIRPRIKKRLYWRFIRD